MNEPTSIRAEEQLINVRIIRVKEREFFLFFGISSFSSERSSTWQTCAWCRSRDDWSRHDHSRRRRKRWRLFRRARRAKEIIRLSARCGGCLRSGCRTWRSWAWRSSWHWYFDFILQQAFDAVFHGIKCLLLLWAYPTSSYQQRVHLSTLRKRWVSRTGSAHVRYSNLASAMHQVSASVGCRWVVTSKRKRIVDEAARNMHTLCLLIEFWYWLYSVSRLPGRALLLRPCAQQVSVLSSLFERDHRHRYPTRSSVFVSLVLLSRQVPCLHWLAHRQRLLFLHLRWRPELLDVGLLVYEHQQVYPALPKQERSHIVFVKFDRLTASLPTLGFSPSFSAAVFCGRRVRSSSSLLDMESFLGWTGDAPETGSGDFDCVSTGLFMTDKGSSRPPRGCFGLDGSGGRTTGGGNSSSVGFVTKIVSSSSDFFVGLTFDVALLAFFIPNMSLSSSDSTGAGAFSSFLVGKTVGSFAAFFDPPPKIPSSSSGVSGIVFFDAVIGGIGCGSDLTCGMTLDCFFGRPNMSSSSLSSCVVVIFFMAGRTVGDGATGGLLITGGWLDWGLARVLLLVNVGWNSSSSELADLGFVTTGIFAAGFFGVMNSSSSSLLSMGFGLIVTLDDVFAFESIVLFSTGMEGGFFCIANGSSSSSVSLPKISFSFLGGTIDLIVVVMTVVDADEDVATEGIGFDGSGPELKIPSSSLSSSSSAMVCPPKIDGFEL